MSSFQVELDNFSGPFDVLLGLISKRKLDITDVALAEVTDEFVDYVTRLREASEQAGLSTSQALDQLSHFLLVAATLLDLKTARLLPRGEVEDELDLELLEARDLLFARLLQYRAYKEVSKEFAAALTHSARSVPRSTALDPEFQGVLPPLVMTATPGMLAALYATVLSRDTTPPTVRTDHVHFAQVSVAEQRNHILGILGSKGRVEFAELAHGADSSLVVVARFLALLELFKMGLCELEQDTPIGPLYISPAPAQEAR